MAKGFHLFSGVHPRTKEPAEYRFSMPDLDKISRYRHEQKLLDIHCVKEICEKPARCYIGIRAIDDSFGDRKQYGREPDSERYDHFLWMA